jgi:hypothetical protein
MKVTTKAKLATIIVIPIGIPIIIFCLYCIGVLAIQLLKIISITVEQPNIGLTCILGVSLIAISFVVCIISIAIEEMFIFYFNKKNR